MNKQIHKFMLEAGYECPEMHIKAQALCELIIRDCAKIADIAEPYRSQDLILDYFGIKK